LPKVYGKLSFLPLTLQIGHNARSLVVVGFKSWCSQRGVLLTLKPWRPVARAFSLSTQLTGQLSWGWTGVIRAVTPRTCIPWRRHRRHAFCRYLNLRMRRGGSQVGARQCLVPLGFAVGPDTTPVPWRRRPGLNSDFNQASIFLPPGVKRTPAYFHRRNA
jgi:hypothetical protein